MIYSDSPKIEQTLQVFREAVRSVWQMSISNEHLYVATAGASDGVVYVYDCSGSIETCVMVNSLRSLTSVWYGVGISAQDDLLVAVSARVNTAHGPVAEFLDCRNLKACRLMNKTILLTDMTTGAWYMSTVAWSGDYVAISTYSYGPLLTGGELDPTLTIFLCNFELCNLTPFSTMTIDSFSPAWGTVLVWNGDFLFVGDPGKSSIPGSVSMISAKSATPAFNNTLFGPVGEKFGASMVISGNTLVVGAPSYGDYYTGKVYWFNCVDIITCTPVDSYAPNTFNHYASFGAVMVNDYDYVVIAAPQFALTNYNFSGAVFALNCSNDSNCVLFAAAIEPNYYDVGYRMGVMGDTMFVYGYDGHYATKRLLVMANPLIPTTTPTPSTGYQKEPLLLLTLFSLLFMTLYTNKN